MSLSSEKSSDNLELFRRSIPFPQRLEYEGDTINRALKDYKTAITETVNDNLKLLDELPPLKTLNIDDVRKRLMKIVEDNLKKDPVFEKSVEIGRYADDIWKYVDSYFREIFEYHDIIRKQLNSEIFDVCRMFFNSDLPMPFLTTIEDAILIQNDYLDAYDKLIRKERLKLLLSRNNRKKFEQLCDAHNRWSKPFTERMDKLERTRIKLFWYTDFNNSATIDEIFKVKSIRSSALDMGTIQNFIDDLRKQIKETEAIIAPKMEVSLFTSYEKDIGARSIRKIMELENVPRG